MECEMSESLRTESVATLQFKKNKCKRLNDLRTSLTKIALVGTFERAKWTSLPTSSRLWTRTEAKKASLFQS